MSSTTPTKLTDIIKPADLICLDLQEYLKTKPTNVIESFYIHPSICLAVYRELPEIARHYVIRILFIEQPVPQAIITSWTSQVYAKEHAAASSALCDLMIWRSKAIQGGLPAWELTPVFEKNLKIALLGGGRPWSMSNTLDADRYARDIAFLDSYAMSRWRCVLHYMVGASGGIRDSENEQISVDAVRILLSANLMKRDENDGVPVITRQGFQFLLLDTQAQVWHFMLQYLDTCEQRGMNLAECLSLLFQLSFSTLGRDYSFEGLSENLMKFLQHLREFGLVYIRKRSAGRFYPTRLALNISSKRSAVAAIAAHGESGQDRCQIIVETNYRIYAYTDSNLQVALLGLFTELLYRFPNVVVGVLTRDSIRQAFRGGITADQIISYLEQHAHPTMLSKENVFSIKTNSLLPPTVIDQIKLWENERNRFTFNEGVAYNQFMSQSDFITLRDYAQSLKVLMWCSDRTRTMVVTKNGHEDVKKFWKRYQKGTTST